MASSSSMCGPSNPLQNLQKHASADKALQQDRLLRRPASATNFRSSPAPGASLLEAEFEQFSGIPQVPPHLQHSASPSPQPLLHHAPSRQHISPQPQQMGGGWVADFMNLNISGSPASSSTTSIAQQKSPVARPRSSHQMQHQQHQQQTGGWAADFLQQQQQPMMGSPMGAQMAMQFGGYAAGGGMFMGGMRQQQQFGGMTQVQGDVAAQFSDQDFDRMFEEAQIAAAIAASEEAIIAQEQAPVVHEQVEEKEEEKTVEEREDPDELARTAGQLLDTLSDNTSQKFKESNFLALMRKLRDHEVRIEGGKMVEV